VTVHAPLARVQVPALKLPDPPELLHVIVPVGVDDEPLAVSVTVAVQLPATFWDAPAQETAVAVERVVAVIVTVPTVWLSRVPSLALYVNESVPVYVLEAVYVTVAESAFGVFGVQATFPIEPSVPWLGRVRMLNASSQVSRSRPVRVIVVG